MQLLRIHYQKLFVCVSFVMLVLVVVRVWEGDDGTVATHQNLPGSLKIPEKRVSGVRENSINIDSPVLSASQHSGRGATKKKKKAAGTNTYTDLFQDMAKEEMCPLCFGHDLCEDVSAGFLTLASDTPSKQDGAAMYEAYLGDMHKLSVKVPLGDRFSRLDEAVCMNASLGTGCSVGSAAYRSFLARPQPLTTQVLHHLLRVVGIPRTQYPLLMCPSEKLLTVIERSFDDNDDHNLSQGERITLFTTLAIAPDIVVLKLLTKASLNVGFPRLVGVCGRLGVLEDEMTPLAFLLGEPFNVRASLAAQILTMVDDFMEDDPDWYLFYGSWSLEKLAVNKEGEVVLTDLASMAVVDKSLFRGDYEDGSENRVQEVCNKECFQKFTGEVYREGHDTEEICSRVEDVGHLMYAAVCAMILSDMEQHKYVDYFTSSAGLLHNIPAADRATVEELLAECVDEAAPGGRLQSAQELRDFLSDFLLDEDEEDGDDAAGNKDDDDGEDYDDDDYDYGEDDG
ncbi:Divergent protein kinase domain 2A-like 1 [Homarus americanus]|uniref:Divergent protein kinase domain 2A-like 1 n=1 Tax=Homarus americanus TaxID=6706 RepID=A0A8J5N230_HOMAM|nr:Divergent protein kinase domain 2A-like 1 [Homarus americanus]